MVKLRDYHKKNYRNPFFRKSKSGFRYLKDSREAKRRMWRRRVTLFFLLVTIFGWVWFLFYSPYFKIEKIEIIGLEKIRQDEIETIIDSQIHKRRFLIFEQNNLFLFDKELFAQNITAKYALDSLIIEKKLPNILIVKIKERISKIIFRVGDKNYNVDLSGIIISETDVLKDAESMPIIYGESEREIMIGKKILSESQVNAVVNLSLKINQFSNIKISFYKIPAEKEIQAFTEDGWYILFTDGDLDEQLLKLDLVLKEKIKDQKDLEYIDLRFGDRVYYK